MNRAKWWREIKKLAGQVAKQEWYHQFLDKDTDIKRLANKINSYFVGLTDHFPPLCQGVLLLSVPDELLISEYEAYKSLSSLQTSKAVGPYNIPNRILKDFALELAPLVCDIYNQSLREGYIPALLKSSIVTPIPKVSPPGLIEQDLRPISLTCHGGLYLFQTPAPVGKKDRPLSVLPQGAFYDRCPYIYASSDLRGS